MNANPLSLFTTICQVSQKKRFLRIFVTILLRSVFMGHPVDPVLACWSRDFLEQFKDLVIDIGWSNPCLVIGQNGYFII